jgi:predicted metal-dependent hydrolase
MSDYQTRPHICEVKIIRSPKRKRTVSARLENGDLWISAPVTISDQELNKIISKFKERLLKKKLKRELNEKQDLKDIAEKLNREYFDGRLEIKAIEYSTNQNSRFGCCNVRTGKILLSHRLAAMPVWVRDYVLVHELAHLIVPNHGKAFQHLISRYKLKERATGFLMAKGYQEDDDLDAAKTGDTAEPTGQG